MHPPENSQESNEELQRLLARFDDYSQKLLLVVDQQWDPSKRMRSVEYCLFLYGAALAIARGYGRGDAYCFVILQPYLSRFMELKFSVRWLLACEAEMVKSRRLQGVQAAGGNTAQAVMLAGSQGRSEALNSPWNIQLLLQTFSELRKLMDDQSASDEPIFAASGALYNSVAGE